MSKKLSRTIDDWGGRATRRRRRVRPHVLKAARRTFVLILVGIPVGIYVVYCLCHLGRGTHIGPANSDWSPSPIGQSAGDASR